MTCCTQFGDAYVAPPLMKLASTAVCGAPGSDGADPDELLLGTTGPDDEELPDGGSVLPEGCAFEDPGTDGLGRGRVPEGDGLRDGVGTGEAEGGCVRG